MALQSHIVQFENKKISFCQMLKEIFLFENKINCLAGIKQGQKVKHLFVLWSLVNFDNESFKIYDIEAFLIQDR